MPCYNKHHSPTPILMFPALVLNLLKDVFERSRTPFNKFRASAKKNLNKIITNIFTQLTTVFYLSTSHSLTTPQKRPAIKVAVLFFHQYHVIANKTTAHHHNDQSQYHENSV